MLGIDGLMLLSRTPIFTALSLDGVPAYQRLWRALAGDAAPPAARDQLAGAAAAAGYPAPPSSLDTGPGGKCPVQDHAAGSSGSQGAGGGGGGGAPLSTVVEDAGMQAIALRCLGYALLKVSRCGRS